MSNVKCVIGLCLAGCLFGGAAMAQIDASPAAMTAFQRVAGNKSNISPTMGKENPDTSPNDAGGPALPRAGGRRGAAAAPTDFTTDADAPPAKLPKTGGDPVTLSLVGMGFVAVGRALRRRRSSR